MEYFIVNYLTYILSLITIVSAVLAGNDNKHAWSLGMFNQLLWLVWIFATNNWGLLPMNAFLWGAFARNYFKSHQREVERLKAK